MKDLGLLLIRLTTGSLLAGHGSQKLFGWFEGPGLTGTSQWLESMNFRPGQPWAMMAGLSEFGGGVLTALGLFHPLGSLGVLAAMGMATRKAHWGKPIWVTAGGAELPVTNMGVAAALLLTGPGKLSLDSLLGTRLSRSTALLAAVATFAAVAYGINSSEQPQQPPLQYARDEQPANEPETQAA